MRHCNRERWNFTSRKVNYPVSEPLARVLADALKIIGARDEGWAVSVVVAFLLHEHLHRDGHEPTPPLLLSRIARSDENSLAGAENL